MQKREYNPEEYAKLKHRIETLKSRVELDFGPEQEAAKRQLAKVERKLEEYEKTHEIPRQATHDYSTTSSFDFWDFFWGEPNQQTKAETQRTYQNSWNPNPNFRWHVHFEEDRNYHEDTRTEEEMVNDLGVLYAIFGSTYQTVLNYHVFKIRFKKQIDKKGAFYRVRSDVYEDNIRICKDINIGFWPFRYGDDKCGDIEFSSMSRDAEEKYNNGCSILHSKLTEGLMDIWNLYFDDQSSLPMLPGTVKGGNSKISVQLNAEERKKVIDKTESDIDSGRMESLEGRADILVIMAYKPYNVLSKFLDESGVVYKVEPSGVYIWNPNKKDFARLVGYRYIRQECRYHLYLL